MQQLPYQNLEIKVLPSHDVIPPKNKHGFSKKRRSRFVFLFVFNSLPGVDMKRPP